MKKKTILLVDDEEIILKSIGKDLRAEGYDVITATNGEGAISRLGKKRFDLIITDMMMEGLDGIQVLKQAKIVAPKTPVIILTGYGDMASAIDALRLGADDYLLKPCDMGELFVRMSRCLEKQDLLEQLQVQNQKLLDEITARKQAEEALKKSSEKIKLFAYSVAHDLKSPAIGLNGLIKLLHKHFSDSLSEKGKSYCDHIVKISEQILALVESINIYTSTREATLTIKKIKPEKILRIIREEFATRLTERHIKWSEPDRIPVITADKLSFLRIFRNLVDNALKYGGDELSEIEIDYKESDKCHIFSVRDNGVGLKEEESKGIFMLFKRQKTARGIGGTGLGLAIVKEIIERHQGEVWTEHGFEKGMTFYFSISKYI